MADEIQKATGTAGKLIQLLPSAVRERLDAWENAVTGLGTVLRDKRVSNRFRKSRTLTDDELDRMYHDDDLASTVVDGFPDAALREGFSVSVEASSEDAEDGSADDAVEVGQGVVDAFEALSGTEKVHEAWRWGRLFGGAGIYVGADDGSADQSEPLREGTIRSILFLTVLDKRDFTPIEYQDDTDAPDFGEPTVYLLHRLSSSAIAVANNIGVKVHASRIVTFPGARTSRRMRRENAGWDLSILQRLHDVMADFQTAWGSVAHVMADGSQGVFKVKNLLEICAGGNSALLRDRLELMDYSRSVVRAITLDADGEDFERKTPNLTGYPEVLDRFMIRFAAASGYPVTILFGRSPAGQNATGESDFRSFFGRVEAMRRTILRPRLERLLRLFFLAKDGPTNGVEPDRWGVKFPPLWQTTPREEAEIRKLVADTDAIYLLNQVVKPEDIAASRFRPEGYSAETVLSEDEDEVETPEEIEERLRAEMVAEAERRELEELRAMRRRPTVDEDLDDLEDEEA